MKKTIIIIMLVIGLVFSFGCKQEEAVTQDIPRYTADQVIAVAKASDPECHNPYMTATWDVRYLSYGRWLVTKTCSIRGTFKRSTQYYFYEGTGALTIIKNK